ncbi:MAG: hypothetical protein B7Z40_20950 [Bosea sp. 12-68-7]|nr:MAG: hypothetical protein B7Z40_20950 [Bosea sp. 12-68-7]
MGARQITCAEVQHRLKAAIRAYGPGTQAAWAQAHGVSPQFVNNVIKGRRGPGPQLLAALGLKPAAVVAEVR